jgi:hypothetical protein
MVEYVMAVNSITSGGMAAFQLQSLSAAGISADKPLKAVAATKSQASNPIKQSGSIVAAASSKVAHDNPLATKQQKQQTATAAENSSSPAGVVSHVIISYNQHGKLRTKFVDSRNHVVYQMPSELVAKLEDQMLTSRSSTDLKV